MASQIDSCDEVPKTMELARIGFGLLVHSQAEFTVLPEPISKQPACAEASHDVVSEFVIQCGVTT